MYSVKNANIVTKAVHQVSRIDFRPQGHTAGYRLIQGQESFLLFGQNGTSEITTYCGKRENPCTHTFQTLGGLKNSHWMCCSEPRLDGHCAQFSPNLTCKAGDVVSCSSVPGGLLIPSELELEVPRRLGLVIRVDERDLKLPYKVAFPEKHSMWFRPEDVVASEEKLDVPVHKGEFRSGKELKCSIKHKPDGVLCEHGAPGEALQEIQGDHWTCCSQNQYFAKCELVERDAQRAAAEDAAEATRQKFNKALTQSECRTS